MKTPVRCLGTGWGRAWGGLLALSLLALASGCATEELLGEGRGALREEMSSRGPSPSLEGRTVAPQEMEEGRGEEVFASLPTSSKPVQVGEAEFRTAMAALLLDRPLQVASVTPGREGRGLSPGSGGSGETDGQAELARDYGRFCERRGHPGDCLTLLDEGPGLQAHDRLKVALALAVEPALEGVKAELRATINPTQVLSAVTLGIVGYMALWLAPDPVFTKGLAITSTLLMWGYLGSELFELIRAYVQLSEESERAGTFVELREAGERFGRVLGPNSVRVLILLSTSAVGQTAEMLSSRAPSLPGFERAAGLAGRQGVKLMSAAATAERLIVSSSAGTLRAVLPVTAMAMVAAGGGNGGKRGSSTPREGTELPSGHRAFKSFRDFKDAMGPAGDGKQWHHIVEQRDLNLNRFGLEALHNTENVIPLEKTIHDNVSAFYSSIQQRYTGSTTLTVRQWLTAQSYEAQRQFGLKAIEFFRSGTWPV